MARINDEKEHYRSLISLFKYGITLFSIFGVIIGYITYSDGKEMRQELKDRRESLDKNFSDLKVQLEKQREEHKDELASQKAEMFEDRERLSEKFEKEIELTQANAIFEIANIKSTSKEIAQSEAKNKINEVFDNKNFDDFVAKIAKERMEPQIISLVDKKLQSNESVLVDESIENLYSNDKVKFMQGLTYLQSNNRIRLNEDQIKKIIKSIYIVDVNYKTSVMDILVYRKSQECTNFFKKVLESEEDDMSSAIQYFIYNEMDFAIISESLLVAINKTNNRFLYTNALDMARVFNAPLTLTLLLNEKKLVDKFFSYIDLRNSGYLKENMLMNLENWQNLYPKNHFSTTYFFQKINEISISSKNKSNSNAPINTKGYGIPNK